MNKIFCLIIMLLSFSGLSAKSPLSPDFAFPTKVKADALVNLKKAVASGDSEAVLRSMIDYEVASTSIDRDSVKQALKMMDEVKAATDNCVEKALMNLLLASTYNDIYMSDRWNYDRRELPDNEQPDDFSLWNGDMFVSVISGYITEAFDCTEALKDTPLTAYKSVIDADKNILVFYPTVYDFAVSKAIDLYRNMSEGSPVLPISYLTSWSDYKVLSFGYTPRHTAEILDLYKEVLEFHKDDVAPFTCWDIRRINFISQGISFNGSFDSMVERKYGLLDRLYNSCEGSMYSIEPLIAMQDYVRPGMKWSPAYYQEVSNTVKKYPSYFRINCLKNIQNSLRRPEISVICNKVVVPGDSLELTVSNVNSNSFALYIYKIPYEWNTEEGFNFKRDGSKARLIETKHFTSKKTIPFTDTVKTSVRFPSQGCYIVVPSLSGKPVTGYYEKIHCTGLNISTGAYGKDRWAYVTDPMTGKPVDGATLTATDNRGRTMATINETEQGTAVLGDKGDFLFAQKGTDRFAPYAFFPGTYRIDNNRRFSITGFTDLAVYHPGDTVRWSGVLQSFLKNETNVAPGVKIKISLFDANGKEKDSLEAVTDEYGRVAGQFGLPDDGLTGNFSVRFSGVGSDGTSSRIYGRTSFVVSDYKLPTYRVIVSGVNRDMPDKGSVTVEGKLESYSGFPLADCNVAVTLSVAPRSWWRGGNRTPFFTDSIKSDGAGNFSVVFPAELFRQSPDPDGIYNAMFNAVTSSGESRNADYSFTLGKPYILNVSLPGDINADEFRKAVLSLSDPMGESVDEAIDYVIIGKEGQTVAKGSFMSAKPDLNLKDVKSGLYTLRFVTSDTLLADKVEIKDVYLYHSGDKKLYRDNVRLWCPVTSYKPVDSDTCRVMLGTTADTLYVHYALCSDDRFIAQGWKKIDAGITHLDIALPDSIDRAKLYLSATYDYGYTAKEISIVRESSLKSITMNVATFRDRLVPGSTETWTISVKDRNGSGTAAALMLDMYSKALNQLATRPFSLFPASGQILSYRYNNRLHENDCSLYCDRSFRYLNCPGIGTPEWNTWGRSLYNNMRYYSRGIRIRGLSAESKTEYVVEEMAYDSAAPMMKAAMSDAGAAVTNSIMAVDEMAVSEDEEEAAVETGGVSEVPDDFSYRLPESPLAFFSPMLTTADDGTLEYTFTVPTSNTTWQFEALAFTKSMLTTTFTKDFVASRPVMVQPNLPRFLRSGDKAVVEALVMNNTDSAATLDVTVETFDPLSEKVTSRRHESAYVEAGQSATIGITVGTETAAGVIGYRIYATDGTYSDGEQSMIPVLRVESVVIDSYPFYVSADTTGYDFRLPALDKDAIVTLSYCDNTAWYLVTALPGLAPEAPTTAVEASAALFSALVAEGVMKDNPAIAEALREWSSSSRDDSVLVSMLERNADLKTLLLTSTPWVKAAEKDTERMTRLTLLLDGNNIADVRKKAVKALSILQCTDGGWSWSLGDKTSSQWITIRVLEMTGRLKQLGYLGKDEQLDGMTARALGYLDRKAAESLKHNNNAHDAELCYILGFYPEMSHKSLAKIMTNTVSWLKNNWRDMDVVNKSRAAEILYSAGDKSLPSRIMKSVADFAVSSPEKGMWWPSLEGRGSWNLGIVDATANILSALVRVEGNTAVSESVRQWLILQKEATDWGSSWTTSNVIATLLGCGDPVPPSSGSFEILVGNRKVNPGKVERIIGSFTTDITSMKPSKKTVTVKKSAGTPSWGAVFCRYERDASQIEPVSTDGISIEKQLYKQVNTPDGRKWTEADSIAVGDVIQVNLIVRAERMLDYVTLIDERAACFEPVDQLPGYIMSEGLSFYRESRDASTRIFVTHMPKGTYRLSYLVNVSSAGMFTQGIARISSQYTPSVTAHTGGRLIEVGGLR